MGLKERMTVQTATYWAPKAGAPFDQFGQPSFEDAIELPCRWEDTQEEYVDANGTKRTSKAKLYVLEDVKTGGRVMLGSLESGDVGTPPDQLKGTFEIKSFSKVPNLKGTEYLRTVMI